MVSSSIRISNRIPWDSEKKNWEKASSSRNFGILTSLWLTDQKDDERQDSSGLMNNSGIYSTKKPMPLTKTHWVISVWKNHKLLKHSTASWEIPFRIGRLLRADVSASIGFFHSSNDAQEPEENPKKWNIKNWFSDQNIKLRWQDIDSVVWCSNSEEDIISPQYASPASNIHKYIESIIEGGHRPLPARPVQGFRRSDRGTRE
jgi:hypothetical protein